MNDAFGTAHRAHASTALIADYFDAGNKMFGYLIQNEEVNAVEKVMSDTERPFTAIMGGSKVSTKIDLIKNLLDKVDNLILAGGMTYTFTKASGGKIGASIVENDKLERPTKSLSWPNRKGKPGTGYRCQDCRQLQQRCKNWLCIRKRRIPDGWKVSISVPRPKSICRSDQELQDHFMEWSRGRI